MTIPNASENKCRETRRAARYARAFAMLALLMLPIGAARAETTAAATPPEADRRAILAMAGDFAVTFSFRETLALRKDYALAEPKDAKGREVVRVIDDAGGVIKLQHMLVVSREGETHVVKHWRQDWTWQPASVLEYTASGTWRTRDVPQSESTGRWSQTVWQTDDSPRYGALGTWRHDKGLTVWQSDMTRRPLPRRDATKNPAYSWYDCVNRHILTPNGWAHEQENIKRGQDGAEAVTFALEYGLNTYVRDTVPNVEAAETYWAKTRDYWADVRGLWDGAARDGVVRVAEEADRGSMIAARLMDAAEEIAAQTKTREAAVAEAKKLIEMEDAGQPPGKPSQ